MNTETRWYLGDLKQDYAPKKVYLYDFKWSCDWMWSGGWIGNPHLHSHFDSAFLKVPDSRGHTLGSFYDPWTKLPDYLEEKDVKRMPNGAAVWEDLSFFLDNPQYGGNAFWRIKDLFKQFYSIRDAAAVFHSGGHCTSYGRTVGEIVPEMEEILNLHIERVIIPEIRKVLDNNKITDETRTLKQKYGE